jgi:hypothetical protein
MNTCYLLRGLAAILIAPADRPQRLDAQSCHTGIIYINLKVADIDVFRREISMIVGTHPIAGVGVGAYWNQAGALSAVKGHHRCCDISIVGIPEQLKIHNAELGQQRRDLQQVVRVALTQRRYPAAPGEW